MNAERLIFWHFFHRIEKELSYERWIEKYKIFSWALMSGQVPFDEDFTAFKRFCKILYLQDVRDEQKFESILDWAIETEKGALATLFAQKQKEVPVQADDDHLPEDSATQPGADPAKNKASDPQKQEAGHNSGDQDDQKQKSQSEKHNRYFHPELMDEDEENPEHTKNRIERYVHSDEYFSITRRQMAKGWQYLRRKEKRGFERLIDIESTIARIARDGLFLEPVFRQGQSNREDTLLIYADCRGSMTPFHEFTRRLIATARSEGGHPKAPVYYFQNYPNGYVFEHPNLNNPVKVKESLLKANKLATIAVIISDAGAARGSKDPERHELRSNMIQVFLDYLNESTAHVIWLNPVPQHRWANTAAAIIEKKIAVMSPVFDRDGSEFPNSIRLLLRQSQ